MALSPDYLAVEIDTGRAPAWCRRQTLGRPRACDVEYCGFTAGNRTGVSPPHRTTITTTKITPLFALSQAGQPTVLRHSVFPASSKLQSAAAVRHFLQLQQLQPPVPPAAPQHRPANAMSWAAPQPRAVPATPVAAWRQFSDFQLLLYLPQLVGLCPAVLVAPLVCCRARDCFLSSDRNGIRVAALIPSHSHFPYSLLALFDFASTGNFAGEAVALQVAECVANQNALPDAAKRALGRALSTGK